MSISPDVRSQISIQPDSSLWPLFNPIRQMENAPFSFWILVAITPVGFASAQVLFSKLKTRHPVTFAKLGSPHLVANNTPKHNGLYTRWLFSAEALLLDETISFWVWVNRLLAGSAVLLFVFTVITMFLG